jgi:hypothetical protein
MELHVVELTPKLKTEMRKLDIGYRVWHGYIILEFDYTHEGRNAMLQCQRLQWVVGGDVSPELRYLLDTPYQVMLRHIQETEYERTKLHR